MARRERGISLYAALAIAFCAVSAGADPLFVRRDRQGQDDVVVKNYASFRVDRSGHFIFKAKTGDKITGIWNSQAMTLEAAKVEGSWSGNQKVGMTIETATLTGSVRAVAKRPSQQAGSSELQTTVVTGDSATFNNVGFALHVLGSVHLTNDDPGAQQALDATGSSADIELTRAHSPGRAVHSATIEGPVKFEMHGIRTDNSTTPPKRLPFTINGVADRMLYNDTARTVTLIGHVHVTADDPTLGGDQNVDRETLHLNPDGSVESVEGEGNPGTTTYRAKSLGGGHL